jgi:hypothetical protein
VKITVRSSTPEKRMRITWPDDTSVQLGFVSKGPSKSSVAVQHEKLSDRAAAEAMKKEWSKHLARLGELLA